MSTATALKHFRHALSRWPKDTIRPDIPFAAAILVRKETILSTPSGANGAAPEVSIKAELEQANALYSLLENRYSNKFKLSKQLLEPRSAPAYYTTLIQELEEAPKRSWVGRQLNKWKGFLRLS